MKKAPVPEQYTTVGGWSNTPANNRWMYVCGRAGSNGWTSKSTADEVAAAWNGAGKVVLITGANGGLGAECVRTFAKRGATVIMLVRDVSSGEAVRRSVLDEAPSADVRIIPCDLNSLQSVSDAAQQFLDMKLPLHILMLNAGVMAPKQLTLTQDGLEQQMGVNYVAHALLTRLLFPTLTATASVPGASHGRVVVVSSAGHYMAPRTQGLDVWEPLEPNKYRPLSRYGQSKLAGILFVRELVTKLCDTGVTNIDVVTCHPGMVPTTALPRHLGIPSWMLKAAIRICTPFIKTPQQGAATQVYLATAPTVLPGEYYIDCNLGPTWYHGLNATLGRKLWEWTEGVVAPFVPKTSAARGSQWWAVGRDKEVGELVAAKAVSSPTGTSPASGDGSAKA